MPAFTMKFSLVELLRHVLPAWTELLVELEFTQEFVFVGCLLSG